MKVTYELPDTRKFLMDAEAEKEGVKIIDYHKKRKADYSQLSVVLSSFFIILFLGIILGASLEHDTEQNNIRTSCIQNMVSNFNLKASEVPIGVVMKYCGWTVQGGVLSVFSSSKP